MAIYLINPDIQSKNSSLVTKKEKKNTSFIIIFHIDKFITETRERLKLEELLHGNYTIQPTFNGTWISDTEITFISSAGDFALYDVRNDKTDIIIYARIMVSISYMIDQTCLSLYDHEQKKNNK